MQKLLMSKIVMSLKKPAPAPAPAPVKMICELCEESSNVYSVLYPDGQSLCIYCANCISQPINKKELKSCHIYEIGQEVPLSHFYPKLI